MTKVWAQRSLVVERTMHHLPEQVWRVLTQPAFIDRWLMKNDFELRVGHRFNFRAQPMYGWNGVTDCEVLEIVPNERLVYSWNASGEQAVDGLKTVVRWTLTRFEGWSNPVFGRRTKEAIAQWAADGQACLRRWKKSFLTYSRGRYRVS